jgi:transposase
MKKLDARSLSAESLELLRRQALTLRRETTLTWAEIAKVCGVSISTVMKWSRWFAGQGEAAFVPRRRGRKHGSGRTLTLAQELKLRETILEHHPGQLKLPFALWNRRAVQDAVRRLFAIEMPIRTVGEYLLRWGFTPQRPARQALERNDAALRAWMDLHFPELVERAKREGGEIYWADETAVKQDGHWVRGYAPAGETPVLTMSARWSSISMISAITQQGLVRFAFHEGAINSERFITFLEALIRDAGRKVFLICDNLKVHHSKPVKAWVAQRTQQIELVYLPSYSPEANPDEYLNRDFKSALRQGPVARTSEHLLRLATGFMRQLQSLPRRVISYFNHSAVAYVHIS